MATKHCKRCGELFESAGHQNYCNKEKTKICPICGTEINYICGPDASATCSPQCKVEYAKRQRAAALANTVRKCKWCGEEFTPQTMRDAYCRRTHYQTCTICGKKFEIDVRGDQSVRTCSPDCKKKLQGQVHDYAKGTATLKANLLAKYGVDNPAKIPGSTEKAKATLQAKHGVSSYTATDEYKQRVKETCLKKYGVEHHLKAPEVIAKREATCLERYGVANVSQSIEVQSTIRSQVKAKYGVEYISQAHIPDLDRWNSFKSDPVTYIAQNYPEAPTYGQLAADLGVSWPGVHDVIATARCNELIRHSKSRMEEDVIIALRKIDPSIVIELHRRTLIKPYELDIYLPQHHFAIECNPTTTHNSSFPDPWGGPPTHYRYHQQKTDACEAAGITLFHLFSYDWKHKREIILSMLKCRIGKSIRLHARKCQIREVPYSECAAFLNVNHRQGNTPAKVRLGLYMDSELVAVMTFGNLRKTIGGGDDTTGAWELLRFCNQLNTTVVGGASKLFSYFIHQYDPKSVVSFSDRARTAGHLYSALGFSEVTRANPGYVWVDTQSDTAHHRTNAQKHNIARFLNDPEVDLTKTEKQLMKEHGYAQVFDSGTIRWEWSK